MGIIGSCCSTVYNSESHKIGGHQVQCAVVKAKPIAIVIVGNVHYKMMAGVCRVPRPNSVNAQYVFCVFHCLLLLFLTLVLNFI